MRKMFQYRLYPTKQQLKKLAVTLEACRWLYNETLAYRKDAWTQRNEQVSWYDSKKRIPTLKRERPALSSVHSQVLQNVTERVELAFHCLLSIARDLNAALNIKAVGLHSVGLSLEAP